MPTEYSRLAGDPAVSSQVLASVMAKVSRSTASFESLISDLGDKPEADQIKSIFNYIDYGHTSIADNAPIMLGIEGVSELLAYFILNVSTCAGAIQQSTRYIDVGSTAKSTTQHLSSFSIGRPFDLDKEITRRYNHYINVSMDIREYLKSNEGGYDMLKFPDEAKKRERAIRNYCMDRARYALPMGHVTSLGLVMSGRQWMHLIQVLRSAIPGLPEFIDLGIKLFDTLSSRYPELIRSTRCEATLATTEAYYFQFKCDNNSGVSTVVPMLDNLRPHNRKNRHDPVPLHYGRLSVSYQKTADFGVIREFNRHRTGTRYALLGDPQGIKMIPKTIYQFDEGDEELLRYYKVSGDPSLLYLLPMATMFPWVRSTTLDKFIYEVEIRTTEEAHFDARGFMWEVGSEVESQFRGKYLNINLFYKGWDDAVE
jgi:thymidylate synthase ThyX